MTTAEIEIEVADLTPIGPGRWRVTLRFAGAITIRSWLAYRLPSGAITLTAPARHEQGGQRVAYVELARATYRVACEIVAAEIAQRVIRAGAA